MIEYYYGVTIDEHYPLLKKLNQFENIQYCFWLDARKAGVTEKEYHEFKGE